ncbi:MAG: hypothetical protein AAGA54_15990 [Myxococcota bacterium]
MTLTTTYAGRSDARTVTSPSCGSLEEATALLLAIALEPRLAPAETPKPAPEPEPEPEPEPPQQPARVEPPARATPRSPSPPSLPPAVTAEPRAAAASPGRRERRLKPSVAAAVGAEWGQIRQPTVAVRLDVGLAAERWRIDAQGRYFAPRRREAAAAVLLMQAGTAGVRGCWTPSLGPWRLAGCAGAEGGALRLDTRALSPAEQRVGPLVGATTAFEVGRRVGGVELWAGVEAFARLWATRVQVQGDPLLVPWPVSPRLWLGARLGRP